MKFSLSLCSFLAFVTAFFLTTGSAFAAFGGNIDISFGDGCEQNTATSITFTDVSSVKFVKSGTKIKYVITGPTCGNGDYQVSGVVANDLDRDCLEMAALARTSGKPVTFKLSARNFIKAPSAQAWSGNVEFGFGPTLYSAGLITACELK